MNQLIECVPNFSEGRRPEIYNAIADAIRSAPEVQVLDVSADPDHNRTVITFVGTPKGVEEGAFRGIAKAKELINLDEHSGEHPRIGATDVVPFIPIKNVTSGDCKAVAYRLGKRVAEELDVAIYYYGLAAKSPQRRVLSDIRAGQYEGWKAEVATKPERKPDEGRAVPAPWGATVIGVRQFLIAYNIYLNIDNVGVAEAVAGAIRNLDGGFRYVQAKGFLVEGQAQVSMNFQYFQRSPLHRVTEAIRTEAARFGAMITHAELVGMIPQEALIESAKWYLQLEIDDAQILEQRLADPPVSNGSVPEFVASVGASTPTPGGGSVAAMAGALAAALAQMVAGLTVGRRKYKEHQEEAAAVLQKAEQLHQKLTEAIETDANAYAAVMSVIRNKSLSGAEREAQLQEATIGAAIVPLSVARMSRDAARLAHRIVKVGNPNAATDAAAAGYMAHAAAHAAGLNVRVNAKDVADRELVETWMRELEAVEGEVTALVGAISAEARRRSGY